MAMPGHPPGRSAAPIGRAASVLVRGREEHRRCTVRIGTRGSALATAQTRRVIHLLNLLAPAVDGEPVVIRTEGDDDKTSPLTLIGGRGVFTSALQQALLRGTIDAAVHSAKDLPSEQPPGLALVAFPEREDARDVLVSRHGCALAELPARPTIGTSSRRRAIQVTLRRPDARVVELRGNVDTRLRKAVETEVDAIILAAAGIHRMGLSDRITEALPVDAFVPSPGQGALAVEVRADDLAMVEMLAALDDPAVSRAVRAERAFLHAIGGGCTMPVGAYVEREGETLRLRAMVASEDGDRVEWADERLSPDAAEAQAAEVAVGMLARVRAAGGITFGFHPPAASRATATAQSDASSGPLAGLSVLVTRTRAQAGTLSAALREQGAVPIELPTIRIEAASDPAPLDDALRRLSTGAYDWVVFTSANAVAQTLSRLEQLIGQEPVWSGVKVAAVGTATAAALARAGVAVDLVPARFDAAAVVTALGERGVAGRRMLYPKGDLAGETIARELHAIGAEVDAVEAYRTLFETGIDPALRERLRRGEIDVVTFASPSSVRSLRAMLGDRFLALGSAVIACIGAVTAEAILELGLPVHVRADEATGRGLVAALGRHYAGLPAGDGTEAIENVRAAGGNRRPERDPA